ncbi:Alpha-L-rhamnosidase [Psilocybe cubensis]|uniref:Alpha-L-rhamnosidase n=1 Tax=Psilocybe cubensis TaxID=181762 RepID=A0ACB8GXQ6_PSICU|nr:Alpha-L-rhamnosidase [Psilocybe cubensis]KAH9479794.1 Alpha-L-rhamnosidase [Psilocybe cubensis]
MLKALCAVAAHVAVVAALDFTGAQWIWIPGRAADGVTYPPGNATFRRDYYPPAGKTPLSANILVTVDNVFTFWVNGNKIGTGDDFRNAHRYCVPLVADCNVFAIEGQNVPTGTASNAGNAAGAIAAIQVRYTDGYTETIVTDSEWHAIAGAPAGFEQVAYDDSNWPAPFVQGPLTTGPWNKPPNVINIPPEAQDPGPDLTAATWIWTNEVKGGNAPIGGRAFRKVVTLPPGELADTITMDIVADNEYTLYINGRVAGSGRSFQQAQRYQVNFIPSNTVTIAVYANNDGGPASLLASGQIRGCACGCGNTAVVNTDSSWKFSTAVPSPAGFINPGFDDSKWGQAVGEGAYGVAPWGKVALPTGNTAQNGPITDLGAPNAPPASVVS